VKVNEHQYSVSYQNSLTMAPHLWTDASGYRCTCSTLTMNTGKTKFSSLISKELVLLT